MHEALVPSPVPHEPHTVVHTCNPSRREAEAAYPWSKLTSCVHRRRLHHVHIHANMHTYSHMPLAWSTHTHTKNNG